MRLRPCLAVLALVSLALTHQGGYSALEMLGAVTALILSLAACLLPERCWRVPAVCMRAPLLLTAAGLVATFWYWRARGVSWQPFVMATGGVVVAVAACSRRYRLPSMTTAIVAGAAVILTGFAAYRSWLGCVERPGFYCVVRVTTVVGFGLTIGSVLIIGFFRRWPLGRLATGLFIAGAVFRHAVVLGSPNPVIDVYGWLSEAPEHLLAGVNPYAADYSNCYASPRARQYGLFLAHVDPHPGGYPPLPILLGLPFRLCRLDVRYANVWCDLTAALVLFLTGRRRQNAEIGLLAAAIYLNLPGAPYLIESAWYEPMIAALLGIGLLLREQGSRCAAVLLGLGVTGKQFGVAMFLPLLRGVRGEWPRVLLGTLALAVLMLLPFYIWDPAWFVNVLIEKHLHRATDLGSITLSAGVYHLSGWLLPRWPTWAIGAALIALITGRTPREDIGLALWMGTALLAFILCNPAGYFNYFYLVEYLFLLGTVGLAGPGVVTAELPQSDHLQPAQGVASGPLAA